MIGKVGEKSNVISFVDSKARLRGGDKRRDYNSRIWSENLPAYNPAAAEREASLTYQAAEAEFGDRPAKRAVRGAILSFGILAAAALYFSSIFFLSDKLSSAVYDMFGAKKLSAVSAESSGATPTSHAAPHPLRAAKNSKDSKDGKSIKSTKKPQ